MKATELRLDNWIRRKESDTFIQVEPYLLCASELINYLPIPLTEEWLLKFGFKEWDKGAWVNKISLHRKCGYYVFHHSVNLSHIKIMYVHQLQNLYFALTGEELQIKEATS